MEMNFLHCMLLTAISLMCFNYFLYHNSMQLSILIKAILELLLKLGRLRHNNEILKIFILSDSLIKNILFLRKELCTELFCINFILIKSKYTLQINM